MSLLRMSLSGAILILAVVVIRAITINKLPKKAFLAFWGIAIVRLLLPVSLPSVFNVFTLTNKGIPVLDSVERGISDLTSKTLASQQTEIENWTTQVLHDSTPTVSALFLLWMIGALFFAGYFLVSYLRCRREFKTSLPVQNDFVKEWLSEHPLRRTMEVRSLTGISTPLTYGLIHPVILMPKNTNWENEHQLRYMLFHEYVHICRFDAISKLIVAAAICIHWFNPIVWVLYILFNRDIELACDECVVRHFGENGRAAYARTLIDMEEQRQGFAPFYNYFAKNAIEERIESIMKFRKVSITALVIVLGIMIAGTATAFAATGGRTSIVSAGVPRATIDSNLPDGYNNLSSSNDSEKDKPHEENSDLGTLVAVNRDDENKFSSEEWTDILEKVERGEILFFETLEEEIAYFHTPANEGHTSSASVSITDGLGGQNVFGVADPSEESYDGGGIALVENISGNGFTSPITGSSNSNSNVGNSDISIDKSGIAVFPGQSKMTSIAAQTTIPYHVGFGGDKIYFDKGTNIEIFIECADETIPLEISLASADGSEVIDSYRVESAEKTMITLTIPNDGNYLILVKNESPSRTQEYALNIAVS